MPKSKSSKISKAETKKNVSESKKATKPRRNLKEMIGYIYGGDMLKPNRVVFFHRDNLNYADHVKDTYFDFYGPNVSGRGVKCEDAEKTFNALMKKANKDECVVHENMVKLSVNNSSALMKKVSGSTSAFTLKFDEDEDDGDEKDTKKDKKSNEDSEGDASDDDGDDSDASDDDDEGVDADENVNNEESADNEDGEDADDSPSEEEEEDTKPAKKSSKKESNRKSNKSAKKSKKSDKTK
jgi:hypothetical protein